MEQQIPVQKILITKHIANAAKQINPQINLKGMKMDPGDQGLPLGRLEENKNKDVTQMPPIRVKQIGEYFSVVDGRHRAAISIAKGLDTIPAIIQSGGAYLPRRYFSGLSERKKTLRKKEIASRSKLSWKNPSAYKPFSTDKGVKTRRSKYILEFRRKFPKARGLSAYSKASGVPLKFVRESYNRGAAAWRTGHRPGATEQQWGYARAASMLTCGKTHYTTDADIVRKANSSSKTARNWFKKTCKTSRVKYQR